MNESQPIPAEQQAAIDHRGHHARLLAGPGTGKTWVLTRRVTALTQAGVPATQILALTFTRYAAQELRRRVTAAAGKGEVPEIRTIHSYALQQLVRNRVQLHGSSGEVRVAGDWEERWIVAEDLKRWLGLDRVDEAEDLIEQLSAGWQRLDVASEDWEESFPNPAFIGALERHRRRYRYVLRAELVYRLREQLRFRPDSFALSGPISHLLVDEYQDLNRCELDVVQALAQAGAEVFVAGDDDQSIYGFRYAHPEGIRRFVDEYNAVPLLLTVCRRSGKSILDLAQFVIEQDFERTPKELSPLPDRDPGRVALLRFRDQHEEASGIAQICRYLIDVRRYAPHDILILLRSDKNGAYSATLQGALEQLGVPVAVNSNTRSVLDELSGQRVAAALRLLVDRDDGLAWAVLLRTQDGIGDRRIEELDVRCQQTDQTFVQTIRDLPADGLLAAVREAVDSTSESLDRLSSEFADDLDADGTGRLITELVDTFCPAEAQDALRREMLGLRDFYDLVGIPGLRSLFDERQEALEQDVAKGSVNLMTMHKAKGLTARWTVVAAAEDQLVPGRSDIDEERRLLYVSLTRAVDRLLITYAENRGGDQLFSGRDAGRPNRDLTRYLRHLTPRDGVEFAARLSAASGDLGEGNRRATSPPAAATSHHRRAG